MHLDVLSYNLVERTHYLLEAPRNAARRYLAALWTLTTHMFTSPRACILALRWGGRGESKYSLNLLFRARAFLPCRSYDVIHCHFGPNGNLAGLLKKIGIIKGSVITTFHGFDLSKYLLRHGNSIYEKLFEIGDLFLPISERWKVELIKLGCEPQKIVVHRMGVETETFAHTLRRPSDGDDVNLLTVGRLVEKKGVC